MLVQITFESGELGHTDGVRRASIRGRNVPVRQFADDAQPVSGFAMLALHHMDRVGDGTERALGARAGLLARGEFADVGKEHLLFLRHMLMQVGADLIEGRPNTSEFWMPPAVLQLQHRQLAQNHRHGRPDVSMVDTDDMFDEPPGRPLDRVVFPLCRRGQCVERLDDRVRIGCSSPAGVDEQAATSATEIDAELLEHTSGAKVRADDLADGYRVLSLVHGFSR